MIRAISSLHVGRSSITPTTCPLGSTPASTLPSTSAALVSIGVFAAISVCVQVSPSDLRIARPSFAIAGSEMPDSLWNRHALRSARGSAHTLPAAGLELVDELGASTRCGHAVDLRGHDGVGDGLPEVVVASPTSGTVHLALSRKRVPIATPAAP